MMRKFFWLICVFVTGMPLTAQDLSTRPKPRPFLATGEVIAAPVTVGLRPKPRPALTIGAARPLNDAVRPSAPLAQGALGTSPRPKKRPESLLARVQTPTAPAASAPAAAAPAAPQTGTSSAPRKGSVCGDRSIRGEKIKPVMSQVKGCGIAEPVRVTEVSGIRLSQAVTIECGTAHALKEWIDSAMRPAFGARKVVQLRIAAHYVCRGRNNKNGARISEHGKGKALDIAGFVFADGKEWTIARDYNKQIRKAHQGACGIFGTTLGPGSDGYHEDHLHFDTADYRSGPYCR